MIEDPVPKSTDPFGVHRFDPESEEVKLRENSYKILECDTCGRKYAVKVWTKYRYRNCCEACTEAWGKLRRRKNDTLMRLFFYRVKVPRDLTGVDLGDLYYKDFTRTDLDVLMTINFWKGVTAVQIVDKLYGIKRTKSGQVSKRSSIVESCQRLIKMGLIRKYNEANPDHPGRRRKKYKLTHEPVTLTKKCPNCENNNYFLLKRSMKIQCINCGLKWKIPGV